MNALIENGQNHAANGKLETMDIERILGEFTSLKKHFDDLQTAIVGNPDMHVDGLHQHMQQTHNRIDEMETSIAKRLQKVEEDILSFKKARTKAVAILLGVASGAGAGAGLSVPKLLEILQAI